MPSHLLPNQLLSDNSYHRITFYTVEAMPRTDSELEELRRSLRTVLRGLWRRRRPPAELGRFLKGEPPIGPRHIAVLVQVATTRDEPRTVGELAEELGLSLPAASRIGRDLQEHSLRDRRRH